MRNLSFSIVTMSKILIINSGSSSIKSQMIEMPEEKILAKGMIEEIGSDLSTFSFDNGEEKTKEHFECGDYYVGLHYILDQLQIHHVIKDFQEIEACGHRVAHGGEYFKDSVIIDDDVVSKIEKLSVLAPMHNPMNLLGYKVLKVFLPHTIQVAVFDTSFHQTMPQDTYIYPIPYEYYEKNGIRKYGFHRTSHHYAAMQTENILGKEHARRLIVCHIGNGASITAIKDGHCINTTMGLSPLGGIMMGTRSGNIDPAIIEHIAKLKSIDVSEVLRELNYKSGLLGISQTSSDMRVLCEKTHEGNQHAQLAIDVYVRRIIEYIGAYHVQLGGLDALVFTAGVGENSAYIRSKIVGKISDALPICLDENKNNHCEDDVNIISTDDSLMKILVIKTNEEMMIARDTYRLCC